MTPFIQRVREAVAAFNAGGERAVRVTVSAAAAPAMRAAFAAAPDAAQVSASRGGLALFGLTGGFAVVPEQAEDIAVHAAPPPAAPPPQEPAPAPEKIEPPKLEPPAPGAACALCGAVAPRAEQADPLDLGAAPPPAAPPRATEGEAD